MRPLCFAFMDFNRRQYVKVPILYYICTNLVNSMSEYPLVEKLQELKKKYTGLSRQLSEPEVMSDMKKYIQLNREYKELEPIVAAGDMYVKMVTDLEGAKDILSKEKDEDLRELAKEEVSSIEDRLPGMEEEIKLLLIPKDPQDDKNAIVEIRGGTGGDEAAIFAGDLFRMYAKYCERKGWKLEINSQSEGAAGGYKEIIFKVSGQGVYGTLKYESVCTECSVYRRQKRRAVCILRQLRS